MWTGGGTVFGPQPRHYTFKVNRKERRAALRSALSLHAERGSLAILDPKSFDTPSTKAAAALLGGWDEPQPTLVVLGEQEAGVALSFRNLARVSVLSATDVGVADRRGAASLLVSRAALARSGSRWRRSAGARAARGRAADAPRPRRADAASEDLASMEHTQVIIRPVVSEKSYVLSAADKYTFRVHPDAHKTQIRQAVEALFDVHVVEVRTLSVKSKPKRRGISRGRTRKWKKAIVQIRPGDSIPIFQGLRREPRSRPWRSASPSPPAPVAASRRIPDFAEITTSEPEKTLVEGLKKSGGRNAYGRKTSRHRGGGAKRLYRRIDFKRRKDGIPARVAAIEYDPNRSAYIALLHYADGEKRYILAPARLQVGATVMSGETADIAASATACRSRACRSAPSSTTSSSSPAAAARSRARPAPPSS